VSRVLNGQTEEAALGRLPKWAQDRIRNLERDLAAVRDELTFSESQTPTRTGQGIDTRPGSIGLPRRWLPDEHVTFYFPDRRRERDTFIQVRFVKGLGGKMLLDVRASDGPLIVRPSASNVVTLEVEDR
jgi:hypothetical protein